MCFGVSVFHCNLWCWSDNLKQSQVSLKLNSIAFYCRLERLFFVFVLCVCDFFACLLLILLFLLSFEGLNFTSICSQLNLYCSTIWPKAKWKKKKMNPKLNVYTRYAECSGKRIAELTSKKSWGFEFSHVLTILHALVTLNAICRSLSLPLCHSHTCTTTMTGIFASHYLNRRSFKLFKFCYVQTQLKIQDISVNHFSFNAVNAAITIGSVARFWSLLLFICVLNSSDVMHFRWGQHVVECIQPSLDWTNFALTLNAMGIYPDKGSLHFGNRFVQSKHLVTNNYLFFL